MVLGPIVSIVISTMENMGYLGLLILMILESLALPIPSEVILPFSGYLIYLGKLNLVLTIIDATVASIIGSLIEYALSYYIGYSAVLKVGKFMGLTESHLKLAESWFNKYGWLSIIAAKFVPGVRALISIPAGIVRMNIWLFILCTTVGSVIWNTALIYIGLMFGTSWETGLATITRYADYLALAFVFIITLLVLVFKRRSANT